MKYLLKIKKAASFIQKQFNEKNFDIAVVFGSGLSPNQEILANNSIPYSKIPNFPTPSVAGHAGRLIFSKFNDKKILWFLGRIHYYEGYTTDEVAFPIRVMKELGIKILVLTNASGSLNKNYKPGEFIIIKDHINHMGLNPLIGPNIAEHGERFPDMSNPYSARLIKLIKKKSKLKEGVYVSVTGPSYETQAESIFYRKIGGDIIGMSTVLETITANHCQIETAGISMIANYVAGISKRKLSHNEVIQAAKNNENKLQSIILDLIKEL